MTIRTDKAQTTMDHELIVAERYRWWGVYLIREKRRLKGIAEAVQAEEAAAALKQQLEEQVVGDGSETSEELLTHVDTELDLADTLQELALTEPEEDDEPDTREGAMQDKQPIPEDRLRRKLAGRARLLASKQDDTEDEAF